MGKDPLWDMERLSSCYFCGIALEQPPATYVFSSGPAQGPAVTLCSNCHQKLGKLVEHNDGSDLGLHPLEDRNGDLPETVDAPTPDQQDVDGEPEVAPAESEVVGDSDASDVLVDVDPEAESSSFDGDDLDEQPAPETSATAPPDTNGDADDAVSDDTLEGEMLEPDPIEADQRQLEAELEEELEAGLEANAAGGSETDDADSLSASMEPDVPDEFESAEADSEDAAPAGAAETETSDPSDDDSDDAGIDGRPSISALEYNKVMRLLQNREFPVDRDEIVAVAASAYDLSEHDCAEVIELAIDRGLLEESGDQLVRPD